MIFEKIIKCLPGITAMSKTKYFKEDDNILTEWENYFVGMYFFTVAVQLLSLLSSSPVY